MEYAYIYFFIFPLLLQCFASNESTANYTKFKRKYFENPVTTYMESVIPQYLFEERSITSKGYHNINGSSELQMATYSSGQYLHFRHNNTISADHKKCLKDLMSIVRGIGTDWAIQMLDSNGKIPSGVLLGNFMWMGKYDECSDVHVPNMKNVSYGFHGLYCVAEWNVTLASSLQVPLHKVPVRTGICLPNSCKVLEMENDINKMMNIIYKLPTLKPYRDAITLSSLTCKLKYQLLSTPASLFLFGLILYGLIPAAATVVTIVIYIYNFVKHPFHPEAVNYAPSHSSVLIDFITDEESFYSESNEYEYDQNDLNGGFQLIAKNKLSACLSTTRKSDRITVHNVLKCFCLISNSCQILNTESTKQFQCIHGIRFLSMAWVILGHTYIHNISVIDNYVDLLKGIDNLPFQVVIQGTFSVDVFFLIGGFLLGYLYLEQADKRNGKISWLGLCFHRFIRITPVYMLLISYNLFMFRYTGSGPFWGDDSDNATCEKYWWWNILYINNFLPLDSMCLTWTWYLANDMQFFVFSSLILYILWRWHHVGLSVFITLLISSWIITWYISYVYDIAPLFFGIIDATDYSEYKERLLLGWNLMYTKPYCRIGPHLIGILLAYILHKNNGKKLRMKLWVQVLGWSVAAFCSLSVIYGLYHVRPDPLLFHFYNAFSRSSFSLGVAWVIYCCLTNHGGLIDKILSYKLWIPLSRLTYCAYLFHPLLMSWYFQSQRVPLYFTHMNMIMYYFAFLLLSYGIAFIISISFEAPLINLEKFFQKP